MGSAPKCGNCPKRYSSLKKTTSTWLLLLPLTCQYFPGTSLGKGLSSVTNVQDLLGVLGLGEVPDRDCKV